MVSDDNFPRKMFWIKESLRASIRSLRRIPLSKNGWQIRHEFAVNNRLSMRALISFDFEAKYFVEHSSQSDCIKNNLDNRDLKQIRRDFVNITS